MWASHAVKRGLSAAQRIQGLISKCSFSAQGRGYWGYTRRMAATVDFYYSDVLQIQPQCAV